MRSILTGLVIGASGLGLIAAPAAGQSPVAGIPRSDALRAVVLVPDLAPASDKEIAGLPEKASAELLTWERVYALALVHARSHRKPVTDSFAPEVLDLQLERHGGSDFARFRTEFLAGRNEETGAAFRDPSGPYLDLLPRLQAIDDVRRHVAELEGLSRLVRELIQGRTAGLSQLDVDLVAEATVRARRRWSREIVAYRDSLDRLKAALGLSPHAAVIPDRRNIAAFRDFLNDVTDWSLRPARQFAELPRMVLRLPALGEALVDGRPILRAIEQDPTRMEDILNDAVRLAITNRGGADQNRAPGEDDVALELRVRRRIRHLLELRADYQEEKRAYELAIRLRDEAFDRLFSPPNGAAVSLRTPAVRGLIDQLRGVHEAEDRLASLWASFRAERLELYRDLGALPYDNWNAFYEDLSAAHGAGAPADRPSGPTGPTAPPIPSTPALAVPGRGAGTGR